MYNLYLICYSVDNSEYMRNGDFMPTRIQAQQDAVSLVCHAKTRQNPENNVALMTSARYIIYSVYVCAIIFKQVVINSLLKFVLTLFRKIMFVQILYRVVK